MSGLPLIFTSPLVLAALVALPAIWFLLRITPPSPQRIPFPPLRILKNLKPVSESASRTSWWLLLLRLLICTFLILACAGPVWNPSQGISGKGPLLLLIDNGFPSADSWQKRSDYITERAQEALQSDRVIAAVTLSSAPKPIETLGPDSVLSALRAIAPAPYLPDRAAHLDSIARFLEAYPATSILWISDDVAGTDGTDFADRLSQTASRQEITLVRKEMPDIRVLKKQETEDGRLAMKVLRLRSGDTGQGTLLARDNHGQPVTEQPFRFTSEQRETEAVFDIPTELRNRISRIEITGIHSAGAVWLLDEQNKRRSVGIASGTSTDMAQPLLSPTYYIRRALQPFADIWPQSDDRQETIGALLARKVDVLILADIGVIDEETTRSLSDFIQNGGLLVRFAGPRMAGANNADKLLPVKLRMGDRNLGSVLSWSQPRKLSPFPEGSPFFGIPVNNEVIVRRQVLAEPDPLLPEKTWASLEDGTPLITVERRGKGMIVLFHVTATPAWSELPLSGLFVDLMRQTIRQGRSPLTGQPGEGQTLAPRLVLDGYGSFVQPTINDRSIDSSFRSSARPDTPPGFYGPSEYGLAVNVLAPDDTLQPNDQEPGRFYVANLSTAGQTVDLRGPLLIAALLLFLLDTLSVIFLKRGMPRQIREFLKPAAMAILLPVFIFHSGNPVAAQQAGENITSDRNQSAALSTRLAYVTTGDSRIDDTSRAGLAGLSQFLYINTAFEPADPVGVDPERDELAFYPLIYWPIAPSHPMPSDQAFGKLDAFMKNGGTILFDTRDALAAGSGLTTSPEALYLQRLFAHLNIPQLEPVPADHVLTKTFYLLTSFPGRYDSASLWVEASTPTETGEEDLPARPGDGVSPVIVTGNDMAAAWAIGSRSESLYPITGGDPRQREMAFRAGANIVFYTLTGNYKADQVHVEDLLERLGRQGE